MWRAIPLKTAVHRITRVFILRHGTSRDLGTDSTTTRRLTATLGIPLLNMMWYPKEGVILTGLLRTVYLAQWEHSYVTITSSLSIQQMALKHAEQYNFRLTVA